MFYYKVIKNNTTKSKENNNKETPSNMTQKIMSLNENDLSEKNNICIIR